MEIYGYIATILMGLSLGMIGGGGSILTVPILVYFFSFNPVAAASNSLFIVGLTAFIGFLISNKNKEVEFKTGLLFAIPSFLGVYITKSIILPMIPDPILSFYGLNTEIPGQNITIWKMRIFPFSKRVQKIFPICSS